MPDQSALIQRSLDTMRIECWKD